MSNAYSKDLERWMSRLIAVWRASRGKGDGPETRLTPQEVKEVGAGVRQLSLGLTREHEEEGRGGEELHRRCVRYFGLHYNGAAVRSRD